MAVWLIQAGDVAGATQPAQQAVQRGEMDTNELARMIAGTPGRTKTFSICTPGAALTGLSIKAAPCGTSAILSRAALISSGR